MSDMMGRDDISHRLLHTIVYFHTSPSLVPGELGMTETLELDLVSQVKHQKHRIPRACVVSDVSTV